MSRHIPPWLARSAAVLSTLAALSGSAFILWAAATGDYWWAIWAGAAFVGAALLWHLGDLGATQEAGLLP